MANTGSFSLTRRARSIRFAWRGLVGVARGQHNAWTHGVVSVVTRSGGNEFYGSFRDSFNNPAWLSQTPLNEPEPDSDLQETYEATFGGRIIRDRLWFQPVVPQGSSMLGYGSAESSPPWGRAPAWAECSPRWRRVP